MTETVDAPQSALGGEQSAGAKPEKPRMRLRGLSSRRLPSARSRAHALRHLLALAVLAIAGCAHTIDEMDEAAYRREPAPPPRVTVYRSRLLPNATRMRVLVLPFRHLDPSASRAVTSAFVLELQKSQMFEVLSPYGQAAPVLDEVRT
jgi:hypothetical protein